MRGPERDARQRRIRELHLEGLTTAQIAWRLGIQVGHASNALAHMGLRANLDPAAHRGTGSAPNIAAMPAGPQRRHKR